MGITSSGKSVGVLSELQELGHGGLLFQLSSALSLDGSHLKHTQSISCYPQVRYVFETKTSLSCTVQAFLVKGFTTSAEVKFHNGQSEFSRGCKLAAQ